MLLVHFYNAVENLLNYYLELNMVLNLLNSILLNLLDYEVLDDHEAKKYNKYN